MLAIVTLCVGMGYSTRGVTTRLPVDVFSNIRRLGLSTIPATTRGKRAGRRKRKIREGVVLPHVEISIPNKENRYMKVAHLNARSACDDKKADQIKDLITDNHIDVCELTETWFKSKHGAVNAVVPSGYAIKHLPRATKTKGGGVAVVHRDTLTVTTAKQRGYKAMECLECLISTNPQCVRLVTIYRPPPKK